MSDRIKKTILIVDDEPDLRDALAQRFEMKGFNVLTAEGGHAAFEIVKSNSGVDLVVSDVRMPEGDGMELLDRVREMNIDVPVCFMTGFSDNVEAEVYSRGAEGLFSKPAGIKDMAEHTTKLLASPSERWNTKDNAPNVSQIFNSFSEIGQAKIEKNFDLGRGGMYLRTAEKIPNVGSNVGFKINFSGGGVSQIAGDGIVRWIHSQKNDGEGSTCGIEFIYLDSDIREQVLCWIKELRTKAYIPLM